MKIFKSKTTRIFLGMLFVMLAVTFIYSCSSGSPSTPSSTSTPVDVNEFAWFSCKYFIEQQYNIPSLKAEAYRASKVQVGDENTALYGMEIFYPDRAQTFNCIVMKVEDGFQLAYLEPK